MTLIKQTYCAIRNRGLVLAFLSLFSASNALFAQSIHPTPHPLEKGAYTFAGFADTNSTTYPVSMMGWRAPDRIFVMSPAESAPVHHQPKGKMHLWNRREDSSMLTNPLYGSYQMGAITNEGDKGLSMRGFHNGSRDFDKNMEIMGIVVALDTRNISGFYIQWDAIGMNKHLASSTYYQSNFAGIQLQYRIGTSGNWTNLEGHKHTTLSDTRYEYVPFSSDKRLMEPSLIGHEVVQFRWLYYSILNPADTVITEPIDPFYHQFDDRMRIEKINIVPFFGATYPVPHVVANSDLLFDGFTQSQATIYPSYMQGWTGYLIKLLLPTQDISSFAPYFDANLFSQGHDPKTETFINEADNGISMRAGETTEGCAGYCSANSFVVALNTKGAKDITFKWKAIPIETEVASGVQVQYRYSMNDFWINLPDNKYISTPEDSEVNATQSFSTKLDAAFEEKDYVQLRWVSYLINPNGGTTTNRISIDSIQVFAAVKTIQSPIAAFRVDKETVAKEKEVQFTDLSAGVPVSWKWNFGDGETSTLQNPVHKYSATGTYTVKLLVENLAGKDSVAKEGIVTVKELPVADFSANQTTAKTNEFVRFNDLSINGILSWKWEFGDGKTSTDQHPVHNYPVSGMYSVKLIVQNDVGSDSVTKSNYITVENASTGLDEIESIAFSIYPNPATTDIFIKNNTEIDYTAGLYTVLGEKVKEQKAPENSDIMKIDLEGLANGIYFLKIENAGQEWVKKIILNR